MDKKQIDQLFFDKRAKKLTNRYLAEQIGCSEALLSMYFNFKAKISEEKEQQLKEVIHNAKVK